MGWGGSGSLDESGVMNVHGQLDMNGESNYIDENFEPNYSENEYSISTEEGISTNILEQKTFNQLKEGKKKMNYKLNK